MGTEKEKSSDISGSVEVLEMRIEDLKDDDKVIWHTDSPALGEFNLGTDGGFIKRLEKVVKKYQKEVKLAVVVGGAIIAVVSVSEQLKRRRK